MLNTTKPFETKRNKQSAYYKMGAISLLATLILLSPSVLFCLKIALANDFLTATLLFIALLAVQMIVIALLFVIGIGQFLFQLYASPFFLLLRAICTEYEKKLLNL